MLENMVIVFIISIGDRNIQISDGKNSTMAYEIMP